MTTISSDANLTTVILLFQVEPNNQESLIEAIIENSKNVMEKKPGFISTNIHKSPDRKSVVNYAQWESRKFYEEAINFLKPDEIKIGEKIFDIADPDWNIYEIAFSAGKKPAQISQTTNLVTIINHFSVQPKYQKKLVTLLDNLREIVEKLPGFVSANVHRSIDGKRVVSYAQWNTREEYQKVYSTPNAIPILDDIKKISNFTWSEYQIAYMSS